jgi:protein SCO1/2
MKLSRSVALSILLCAAGCGGADEPACCGDEAPAAALPSDSLLRIESRWTDAAGEGFRFDSLRGRPAVVAMFFTHCQYVCPRIVAELKGVEDALPAKTRANVRFVLCTLDPERDDPARLAEYARDHRLDPARWRLLTADAAAVRELSAALGIRYKQVGGGDIAHSIVWFVLDPDGRIARRVEGFGSDPAPVVELLRQYET